ncbi:MAG: Permease of the drug/metabolite transporter (DMT) superfamily [uncultured Rubrobacteraceae bacterium]|uniref:Permease of the drug/metabolite transporter (DMT) superfamily n=1 Tax=uncultured Rubrobacteraceae bacterium TaxID=349277 RepID=A0A6J4PVV6_9ACTN|nr:MAG: Permease of the drug/metabolite transporter (DMT) superfamily [uncultured Rubrobacteraceae bacterium]
MIRLADAPALAVAFWRCALGVVILLPPALLRRDAFPKGKTLYIGIASGLALGAHFGFWISSLDYTSVAASVVLVSNTPVFVAILAYLIFGEKTAPLSFAGILVALAGTVVIAQDDSAGSAAVLGNALALLGALTFTVYVLVGRSQRSAAEPVGVLPYSIVLYSAAAAALLPAALLSGDRVWGYGWETWFWLLAITLGPQILGHTVFNWALRYVEASVISGTVLAEPVIAALLAWLILSERPGTATLVGGAVVLAGIFLLLRGRRPAVAP